MEVALSSSSVNVGERLGMRAKLTGPAAWNVCTLSLTVTNSDGENVYTVGYWLPHRTLAPGESPPQEYVVDWISWDAKSSPWGGNVEVTPGTYSFIIVPSGFEENMGVRGTIEVQPGATTATTPSGMITTTPTLLQPQPPT